LQLAAELENGIFLLSCTAPFQSSSVPDFQLDLSERTTPIQLFQDYISSINHLEGLKTKNRRSGKIKIAV
jgi:hypothetical protein